jgi:hypothetical protein
MVEGPGFTVMVEGPGFTVMVEGPGVMVMVEGPGFMVHVSCSDTRRVSRPWRHCHPSKRAPPSSGTSPASSRPPLRSRTEAVTDIKRKKLSAERVTICYRSCKRQQKKEQRSADIARRGRGGVGFGFGVQGQDLELRVWGLKSRGFSVSVSGFKFRAQGLFRV